MNILGLHASFNSHTHDPSACVISEGSVQFAIEEERLTRNKTASGQFPERAVKASLDFLGLSIRDIDLIAVDGSTYREMGQKIQGYIEHLYGECPPISIVHPPAAHAAGAFYSSTFEDALVFSVDGVGDKESTSIFMANRESGLNLLHKEPIQTSLGIYYSIFTSFLGFKTIEGEYKLMGMASFGEPRFEAIVNAMSFCHSSEKIVTNFPSEMNPRQRSTLSEPYYQPNLAKYLGIDRPRSTHDFTQDHYDVAASVQKGFENAYLGMINHFSEKYNQNQICLSGGCALNCLANSRLEEKSVYIMPAASDRGLSIGSGFFVASSVADTPSPVPSMSLGLSYSDEYIHQTLKNSGLQFSKEKDPAQVVAQKITEGLVVGWHQGRSEFGPRALGNRSILASTQISGMKDRLNKKIKFREQYRPFAPAILESEVSRHSPKPFQNSFMTSALLIESDRGLLAEAINVDNTARVQTVREGESLYPLLTQLKTATGYGGVINTSFNLAGEPIVETPEDALRTFVASGIDTLSIGNFVVEKNRGEVDF